MFDVPKRYIMESVIEPKTFVAKNMKKDEKDRVLQNLLSGRLVWQILGEEIPSVINDDYNCSVIMGLDVKLKAIRHSTFFAELVQRMVKAPCIVRFYDQSEEVYSYAHKRLNRVNTAQIVVEQRTETPALSLVFPDKTAAKLKQYLSFDKLLNKSDKLSVYLEAMVKAYIISNPNLYNGVYELLDRKLWYDCTEILSLFERLRELERLNDSLKSEKLPGARAKMITKIKTHIASIREV